MGHQTWRLSCRMAAHRPQSYIIATWRPRNDHVTSRIADPDISKLPRSLCVSCPLPAKFTSPTLALYIGKPRDTPGSPVTWSSCERSYRHRRISVAVRGRFEAHACRSHPIKVVGCGRLRHLAVANGSRKISERSRNNLIKINTSSVCVVMEGWLIDVVLRERTHTHRHTHTHTQTNTHTYTRTHTHTQTDIHTHTHTHTHIHTHIHTHTNTNTQPHTQPHTQLHTM